MDSFEEERVMAVSVSASCFAEYITSSGSPESKLRPFKFPQKGEGHIRSSYYPTAIAVLSKYHKSENDPNVFTNALLELRKKITQTNDKGLRTKYGHNATAIESYRETYKDRIFKVLPKRTIAYQRGPLLITVQPDLWAEENGILVLVKIGITRKHNSYVDILLTIIRKAAISHKYRVRAKNVVYLDIMTGKEMICKTPLTRFNRTFNDAAREIARVWPNVNPLPPKKQSRALSATASGQ
jgi:hypothetical protein